MSDTDKRVEKVAERLAKELADTGKLLEAGWQTYRLVCLKLPTHEAADDRREAFMAGAEHTFASIVGMLDPGPGITNNDLHRMNLLHAELEPVRRALRLKYGRTAGSA